MDRPGPYGVQWDEYECNEETKQRAKKRRTEFFTQEAARETLQGAGRHEARGTVSFYLFLPVLND
jgi:hypothetical protein